MFRVAADAKPLFKAILLTACGFLSTLVMPEELPASLESRSHVGDLLLENGLQLVWEEDHRQPLVAIEARIKGGLRGEGPLVGSGITHFIEHMLFKGTPSRSAGTIEQEVRRYGGTINAFTSFDVTGVSLFVESRYLKEGLALLSDILQNALFDPDELEKERAVVLSEIQMNLDDPDRRIQRLFWRRHLLEHPYRHPILGYPDLLKALTLQDMTAFYAAQYQPQNITIACVGDLSGESFPELAEEIFGSWPRGKTDPRQQIVPMEPPSASAKQATIDLPVQSAYVMLGFSSVRLSDPELYPLDVLANIVGAGRSSRLYETLIRRRQLADQIQAWNYTPYDPGVFAIHFRTDAERIDAAKKAVVQVLEEIKERGVTEEELAKAKHMVSADYLFGLQTIEARAGDLATSMASTGDALFSRHYVSGIEAVTRQEVQQAARRFLDPSKMTSAIIRPASEAKKAGGSPAAARSEPVALSKMVLASGATALLGEDHSLPIASVVVGFRGGVRVETEEKQGLSNLVAQLLTKGTKRQTALQIAQRVESLGGTLEPFSGRDGFGLVLQVLAKDLPEGLSLMHELVSQSTFPEEELALQRHLIARQLKAQEDEIFDVGARLLRRALFEAHPYRFQSLGSPETIDALGRADCLQFAKRWMTAANAVIAVFGDIDPKAVSRQLGQTFGTLPQQNSSWPDHLSEPGIETIRKAFQTMDKEQALIMLGFRGSAYSDPHRYALDVMTAILSGMAGRLFQSVREEHGLSYTLGAVNVPGWDPGYLIVYAATRPNEQERVLGLLNQQLVLALERGFTDQEVEEAKRYLIGLHRMDLQQVAGLARRSVLDELYGLGFDAWTTYEDKIQAMTVVAVNEAARRYLTVQQCAQVVITPNGRSPSHAVP